MCFFTLFSSMMRRPPIPILFPYTTLFRSRGDRALIEFGTRFDRVKLTPAHLRVRPAEMEAARRALAPAERRALELAARRIREFRSEEHTSELQSRSDLVCRLLPEKKK